MPKKKGEVKPWGRGHQDYTRPPPTSEEKKMLVVGITFGAIFGAIGSFMVASSFRILDKGISPQNMMFLISSIVVFVFFIAIIPKIIKKL